MRIFIKNPRIPLFVRSIVVTSYKISRNIVRYILSRLPIANLPLLPNYHQHTTHTHASLPTRTHITLPPQPLPAIHTHDLQEIRYFLSRLPIRRFSLSDYRPNLVFRTMDPSDYRADPDIEASS